MTNKHKSEQVRERVDNLYHTESRRIFATLIRLLGDFDLAEDALHEAFRVAMEQWPRDGVPLRLADHSRLAGRPRTLLRVKDFHSVFTAVL
jgi:RNA polymerase sigma-70 factor (ECF subfamily)